MSWLENLTLGALVARWKTVMAVIGAIVVFGSGAWTTVKWIDDRYVKSQVYAGEIKDLRGTSNYQANEIKLGKR